MNIYTTDKIRNVVILGHGGSGKTTLVEAAANLAGLTDRMGSIENGNTISDYDKEEVKRGFSIGTSLIPIDWEGTKINFLDTPGFFDFVGEVQEAVSAADAAIIVVSGKSGIEVGTKKAWEICEKYNIPRMFYISNMDNDNASMRVIVEGLQELYGKKIAPFHFPVRENEKFIGYCNVISQNAFKYTADGTEDIDVPGYLMDYLNQYREALVESVAETSEDFMDRYFNGDEFSDDEIRATLRVNVAECGIVPVCMGSSTMKQGIYTMLDDIIKYFPSPDRCHVTGINAKSNEVYEANYDFSKPKSAYVFKTIVDPFMGKYSFIKVNSGVIKTDDVLYNQHKDFEEKIGKLYVLIGNKPQEVKELHAGDIGVIAKLQKTTTTDSLSTKANPILYIRTQLAVPYTAKRYRAKDKNDEDKISQALQKLAQEDLTIKLVNDSENGQTLIYAIGDMQIDVIVSKLLEKYKVDVELIKPHTAFKETITKKVDCEYKYKKQSGGHGQYGHVKMTFEPSGDLDTAYTFDQVVVGGAVPKNFFPAVEKGIAEAVKSGPMAAYPVVGIKAVLYDGSYHAVDSSEQAFKTAAAQCLKKGILEAGPILMEPINTLKVVVPDTFTGDVMGDLNKRRGRVLGMNPMDNGYQEIVAEVPARELYGYCTALRSMTGGAGDFSYEFVRFENAPKDLQEAQIEKRKNKLTVDEE